MEATNKNFIILFHPLNTLYSYSFNYLERSRHIAEFAKSEQDNSIKQKISILPYITKEVLDYYKEKSMLDCFRYLASNEEEKQVIAKEHSILGLDQYYKCHCVTLEEVAKMKVDIVMI